MPVFNPEPAYLAGPIPAATGIGLRPPHVQQVLDEHPPVPWFEMHSENFFCAGGEMLRVLQKIRSNYPLSLHGVGLSLGSSDRVHAEHLAKLKSLVERIQPALISEHLCWGAIGPRHLNELLPLPYTEEALTLVVEHVQIAQEVLGRPLLVENISSYLSFTHSTIPEWEFVAELARRSGCGLLLDVNNVYVNSVNHAFNPHVYIRAIPAAAVKEIHLAGFTAKEGLDRALLIDSHSRPVSDEVWNLYREALIHTGPVPTLIEWDQDIPEFEILQAEARKAEGFMNERRALAA